MIKGNYYYMEAVHKELFGEDDLEVAVQMQSGKFIGPIEERYLYYYYKSSKLSKTVIIVTKSILLWLSSQRNIFHFNLRRRES